MSALASSVHLLECVLAFETRAVAGRLPFDRSSATHEMKSSQRVRSDWEISGLEARRSPFRASSAIRLLSNPYSRLSTSACRLASMMFSLTPIVVQVDVPSLDSMSTRVRAAVPTDGIDDPDLVVGQPDGLQDRDRT